LGDKFPIFVLIGMATKNLVIVESPAKARTIERFLGNDFLVKSSFGHVMDLSESDIGVDIENGFIPQYKVAKDKKNVVADLKKIASEAETIWLATDEDREGEAISWHLVNALELDEQAVKRIVFHEITKTAITEAISAPRSIDRNLVNAQTARRVLDRLVGYELSPLLWKKVKPALSAGRVQSVAVRLIVEREDEIKNFETTSSYRVTAKFFPEGKEDAVVSAELPKRFQTKEEAKSFLEKCTGAEFRVSAIEKKPAKKSPAPPFTTSTLQQEASRKLGFPVAYTMRIAQQLYESGYITYMRTDSVNLSNMALSMAKETITKNWGADYVKTRKYRTSAKGAQEAHEAIRPTFINNETIESDKPAMKLYELIWKRTIASQMADARLEKTNVTIDISGQQEKFMAKGEVVTFDGFLKVYIEGSDERKDENGNGLMLPPLTNGDQLFSKSIMATQRFTQHPLRYTEASLVKKMEELGIGRPSTYAPTISTIQKREYVKKNDRPALEREYARLTLAGGQISEKTETEKVGGDKGKLIPTDLGTVVNSFLMQYFKDIIDYNFTADVEKEFDRIANGQKVWNEMLENFYGPFHDKIKDTQETSKKFSGEKLLGQDPKTGKNVYVKIGKYGPMVQLGDTSTEEKPRFAGLNKDQSINDITLEDALALFSFPKPLGDYEGKEIIVALGKFGPYVKHNNAFFALEKTDDPSGITRERAIELIEAKREEEKNRIIREFEENKDVRVLRGRYGPYISIGKKNFKIPKGTDPESLTLEDCIKISEDPKNEPKKRRSKKS